MSLLLPSVPSISYASSRKAHNHRNVLHEYVKLRRKGNVLKVGLE